MNADVETRTIAGIEVTTVKMRAMRGARLRHEVQRMIAEEATRRGASIAKLGGADVDSVIVAAMASMPPDVHERFMLDALRETSVVKVDERTQQRRKIDLIDARSIDDAFGTDHYALDAAVNFALEVNLRKSFADGAGDARPTPTP